MCIRDRCKHAEFDIIPEQIDLFKHNAAAYGNDGGCNLHKQLGKGIHIVFIVNDAGDDDN